MPDAMFTLPPCGRCRGRLISDGEGLVCLNCGHEPDLKRLGMSSAAMDPLRLLMQVMSLEEALRTAREGLAETQSSIDELGDALAHMTANLSGLPVPKKLKPVRCPQCGARCRSPQGLVSHQRSCPGA